MGIVIRQSAISSLIAYTSIGVGYINAIILMPMFMSPEEIGLIRTLLSISMLLIPLAVFGTPSSIIRFFPEFKEKRIESILITINFTIWILAFLFVWFMFLLFDDQIALIFLRKSPTVNDHIDIVISLLFLMSCFQVFESISKANLDIITPNIFREFGHKILHSLIIFLLGLSVISFDQYLVGQVVIYGIILIGLILTVGKKYKYKKVSITDILARLNGPIKYSSNITIGAVGSVMIGQIGQIWVSKDLGLKEMAIYTTALLMITIVETPKKFISQISLPLISRFYNSGDIANIELSYKKASVNSLLIGGLLFLGVFLNLESIYTLMPNGNEYRTGYWIVFIIGIAKLSNALFSLNGEILTMTKYYRIQIGLIIITGILNVSCNFYLVPMLGLHGAAYSMIITLVTFNILKFYFVNHRIGISPFSLRTVRSILILAFIFVVVEFIPRSTSILVDILLRSSSICVVFLVLINIFRPSEDLILIQNKILLKAKTITSKWKS
ncbi:MAG: polysaccharide biosynthesis C-terminal domain-containing protein [Cyclobacteriaceae bacterium]